MRSQPAARATAGWRWHAGGVSVSSADDAPGGGLASGTEVGPYRVTGLIGRGGMGVVYEARHLDLDRVVALKVMLAGAYAGEDEARRFVLEAEASARLKHPHIVAVHDIGEVDGQLFFTMDLIEGQPLSKAKAGLSRPAALALMIQVAHAVAFAHARGIIHRDLKPQNVMVGPTGEPVIMDFGLAKQVGLDPQRESSFATREGAVMGTPHYMPPEQAVRDDERVGPASDVWALGAMLVELFTALPPWGRIDRAEIVRLLAQGEVIGALYVGNDEIKHLFDPAGVLNPGVLISDDPDAHLF